MSDNVESICVYEFGKQLYKEIGLESIYMLRWNECDCEIKEVTKKLLKKSFDVEKFFDLDAL